MHTLHNITLTTTDDGFTLSWQDRLLLSHSAENPCLWIGAGVADIDMFRGNFSIKDKLNEKIALTDATTSQSPDGWLIHFNRGDAISAALHIATDEAGRLTLKLQNSDLTHNRIWLRPPPSQKITSMAAANSSLISICAASLSRSGPANKASGATKTAMSPGRRTAKKTRAGITTGPFSHSPLLSARKSTTATSITAAT